MILDNGDFETCWKEIKQIIRGFRITTLAILLYNDKMFMKHSKMKKIIIYHNYN